MTEHGERLHSLDAVRAAALLLGIVLHATMSFFIVVPAEDVSRSATLAVLFYVIHIFRMSAFYLIAGFFAHMLFHRRGWEAFVRDRIIRISIPMIAGWLVIGWPTAVIVFWGVYRTFGDSGIPPELAGLQTESGLPLFHFWFLYYLLVFYVAVLGARILLVQVVDRRARLRGSLDRFVAWLIGSPFAPAVLAAPLAIWLHFDQSWMPWFGIPTPDTGPALRAPAMIGFGTAFAFGWLLHRQTGLLEALRERWPSYLLLAVALTIAALWIVGPVPDLYDPLRMRDASWARPAYAVAYCMAIWCWTFALIGAAMRFCAAHSPFRRYLADASYWLYIAHLPIVFGLQVALARVPVHWSVKFPLVLTVTMIILLVSYRYLVRPTFLGQLLNGRSYPRDGSSERDRMHSTTRKEAVSE